MAQTRIRPEQVRLDLDWNFTGHLSVGEDGIIAATRLLDIDGITTGFGAVLTPSMGIDSPLFYGLYTRLETEVAAITVTDAISLFVEDPIKGAGSTMTNLYGLCIEDLTQGTARNWAVCIRGDNPIVWANDTNLYRGAANILKTDDSFQATRVFTGDGLVGSPAHSFISDVDVGMYRIGVNDLGFTTNSTLALELNAVQQALVTNGTDGAPGLGFISDPDTGLYRIGANRLGITTAGAFAVEIDATGQVGIGRTPTDILDIAGTAPHLRIDAIAGAASYINLDKATVQLMQLAVDGTDSYIDYTTDLVFRAGVEGVERVRIEDDGDIGIATATPAASDAAATARTLQMGDRFLFQDVVGTQAMMSHNAHYDGAWKYVVTDTASAIRIDGTGVSDGSISFHLAASDTGGNALANWDTTDIRMLIKQSGIFMYSLKSGANQAAAGAIADELWHDTDDESIKIGV